jgi:hypothetical protein
MSLSPGTRLGPYEILSALIATVLLAVLHAPAYGQITTHRLLVAASNQSGAPVGDLRLEEFELREGGEKRDISRIAVTHRPIRIALLVDTGVSNARVVAAIRQAMDAFFASVGPEHEIVLMTTGGPAQLKAPPTIDHESLEAAIDLRSAIVETYNRFLRSGAWSPILVVLTLGVPGTGAWPRSAELDRVAEAIRSNGGAVHGVVLSTGASAPSGSGLSEFIDHGGLNYIPDSGHVDICVTLRRATGGLCAEAGTSGKLKSAAAALARRIHQDYRSSAPVYEVDYPSAGRGTTPQVRTTRPGVRLEILSSR